MARYCFAITLCIALGINAKAQLSEDAVSQNSLAGVEFLEENRAREGVITLASGLQYEVLRRGDGDRPESQNTVVANFRGTLVDGTVFDTTYVRSTAATISLNDTLAGLSEGLALMREGAKYRFVLPPELAYGTDAPDEIIGPNSTLIYEIELLLVPGPLRNPPTAAERNLEEGRRFLEENGRKPDVVTLDSGLQYKIHRPGNGPLPKKNGSVTVHYAGRFINGAEFDSSYTRNETSKFRVNRVIPGWTEALRMMPEGAYWEIFVPADLAYGKRGSPPAVPPNTALIFTIEMIKAR
jgi:FKBP-type peptidyl-prolyl cis-trans isomerase